MAQEDPALACRRRGHRTGLPAIRLAAATPGGNGAPPLCRHIYSLDRRDDYLRQQQAFAAEQPFFSVVRLGRLVLTSAFWNGPTRCCGRWRIFGAVNAVRRGHRR